MADATDDEPESLVERQHRRDYPVTTDGWVTFQRIRMPRGIGVVLVQKRDGCTRTVRAR